MFVITVRFKIRPEHVEDFMAAMNENAALSFKNEEGCLQFDVCVAPDDPTDVFLYERYRDRAAFDAHKETDHFKAFDKNTADWIAAKSVAALHRAWPDE